MPEFDNTRILITVLTYPHPSAKYEELVCTAGISENGELLRLYPIDYRYLPREKQFHKYQWIEVGLTKGGHKGDSRKESRRPDIQSIKILGSPLTTVNKREKRRAIVEKLPVYTLNQLKKMYESDKTSLGLVKPSRVIDLEIAEEQETWSPQQEAILKQLLLFGERKPLRKIPFRFRYVFECSDSDHPHKTAITDWEVGALWLKELDRLRDEKAAAESVRKKFLHEICGEDKDTRFFMGTVLPYNTWLVLGVFWPPKKGQSDLF